MGAVGTTPADLEYPNGTRAANTTRHGCPSPDPSTERFAVLAVAPGSSNNRKVLQLESEATTGIQTARTR